MATRGPPSTPQTMLAAKLGTKILLTNIPHAAALIIGDKTDVRRSRVREKPKASFDIHDRVNYAVTDQTLKINTEKKVIRCSFLCIR